MIFFKKDDFLFFFSIPQISAPDLSSEWRFPVQLIVDKLITLAQAFYFMFGVKDMLDWFA